MLFRIVASRFGLRLGTVAEPVHDSSAISSRMCNAELLLPTELPQRVIAIARPLLPWYSSFLAYLQRDRRLLVEGLRYDAVIGAVDYGVLDVSKKTTSSLKCRN